MVFWPPPKSTIGARFGATHIGAPPCGGVGDGRRIQSVGEPCRREDVGVQRPLQQ